MLKIPTRIREKTSLQQPLNHLALNLQTGFGKFHQIVEAVKVFFFRARKLADLRHIDGNHADGAGEFVGAEKTAAPFPPFALIQL